MKNTRAFIPLLIVCLNICTGYAQKSKINTKIYKLENVIEQNQNKFNFWRGSVDSNWKKIIIEKISNGITSILYDDYVRDGLYEVIDRNGDGFKDFITTYHDYDLIYFFDPKRNRFTDEPLYLPGTWGLLDSSKNIYWGYYDTQYGELYDYSIIYKITGNKVYNYYQLKYITPTGHQVRTHVTNISVYRFANGDYQKPVLVKIISANNPGKFDYKKYWKENYQVLLSHNP
jgi:hypothetical protein